uniref:Uncharacterized protein n=1 Tax=Arundo donax TaxID=35708 RepID=A0A0A8ZL96_ARUDO
MSRTGPGTTQLLCRAARRAEILGTVQPGSSCCASTVQ